MIRCVEFFSGLGGLHYALQDSGADYELVAAYDNNAIANAVYAHNFHLQPTAVNLEHLPAAHFERLRADCWLLSPPCQPYTRGGKLLDDQDARATPLLHLVRVLGEMARPPRWLFLENVLNFEKSRSRDALVSVLRQRGYRVREFLLTPMDLHVAIPNDRLRYYLIAERDQKTEGGEEEKKDPLEMTTPTTTTTTTTTIIITTPTTTTTTAATTIATTTSAIIRSFSEILGPAPFDAVRPIADFLRPAGLAATKVPEDYIRGHPTYRHDIATPESRRSATFTKAYGSSHIIGTGSLLQTERLGTVCEPDDVETLLTLGLCFFSPREVALLHALPVDYDGGADDDNGADDDSDADPHKRDNAHRCDNAHKCDSAHKCGFSFPEGVSVAQQYRLLGNSLNVRVVSLLLSHMLGTAHL